MFVCCVWLGCAVCVVRCWGAAAAATGGGGGGRGRSRKARVTSRSDDAPAASDRSNDGSDTSNLTTPRREAGPGADATMDTTAHVGGARAGSSHSPALKWEHNDREAWSRELEQVALQGRALSVVALHGELNMSDRETKAVMDFIMVGNNALVMYNWHLLARFWAGTRGGLCAFIVLACRSVCGTQFCSIALIVGCVVSRDTLRVILQFTLPYVRSFFSWWSWCFPSRPSSHLRICSHSHPTDSGSTGACLGSP